MGIKKLVHDQYADSVITVRHDQVMLTFKNSQGEPVCLLVTGDDIDLKKFDQFVDIQDIKCLGNKDLIYKIFEKSTNWPRPEKIHVINHTCDVYYYPETGKIRFSKKEIQVINFEFTPKEKCKKKVLVVDDSKTIQKLLTMIINTSDELEVMDIADCAEDAKAKIEEEKPDLITLDIHMPGMTGIEFLKTYLKGKNIPTVMISSVSVNEGPQVLEALDNGAMTFIQKPSLESIKEIAPDIISRLEVLVKNNNSSPKALSVVPSKAKNKFESLKGLIAIGSSTGGTQALQEVFCGLPDEIPPIVVVQHIPAVFSKALADRLNEMCKFTVKEAVSGEVLTKNTIYIAPGGKQMRVLQAGTQLSINTNDDEPVNRFKPSVDYTFKTLLKVDVDNLVGVILTGMGKDGAEGLLGLQKRGAFTIAQDQSSSVVFGMPKEAIRIGAADKISSLHQMADCIVDEFNKKAQKK